MPGAVNLHARLVAVQSSLPDPNILSTQSSQKKKRKKKRKKIKERKKQLLKNRKILTSSSAHLLLDAIAMNGKVDSKKKSIDQQK